MLNEGNQTYNFIPTVSVRTFVIPFYYCSGSGSDFLTSYRFRFGTAKSYGSGSATLPVGGHPREVGLLVPQPTAGPHNHLTQGRQQGSCNI
jgi:hypothetical protein